MKPLDLNKNSLSQFNFKSNQPLEEFLKTIRKEELGVVESPIQKQLKTKINSKLNGKIVYFKDFIDEIVEDSNDIINAEIVKGPIKVKLRNEEL